LAFTRYDPGSVCVLCGSPVWPSSPVKGPLWGPPLCVGLEVPCVGPLCGSPVWVPSVWVPCVGPLCGSPVWVPRPVALRHVASTRVMSPARSHAPALPSPIWYGVWHKKGGDGRGAYIAQWSCNSIAIG